MKTTLDEYLGQKGLGSPIDDYMLDKLRLPHGQTERQHKQMLKEAERAARKHYERRIIAIKEYEQKIASGEFVEKTIIEQLIDSANGHPDNASTQAARRALTKRGVNWEEETGQNQ